MKVNTILDQIDLGTMALPEFQRGYVWSRNQVRQLMQSMYSQYPVGSLLVWETKADSAAMRGSGTNQHQVKLLLDGQQRITSLYGIMRGNAPTFFQGNEKSFKDLFFDLREESFQFYGPVKMRNDPLWVDVTELYKEGLGPWFGRLNDVPELADADRNQFFERLNKILSIADTDLHVDSITGQQHSLDTVVDIFNRVNSGGTKLSKGDLALARLCAEWPDARAAMNSEIERWSERGFDFKLDWLLRVVNAVVTGEALFNALRDVDPDDFRSGLESSSQAVDRLLNLVSSRLGLDHNQVLGGRYAFPVMAKHLVESGWPLDAASEGKLLYWYVHCFMWGRHTGSTETVLNQDLHAVEAGGVDGLVELLGVSRGDLGVRPEHFGGSERGSRFYSLLYLLSRVWGARDFGSGNELSAHLLGRNVGLQLHHIFPKALLQEEGHGRRERNALANFCFLTAETNQSIGRKRPREYFAAYEEARPGVLASQWIPMDESLWHEDRYLDFLEARRALLADAANGFLNMLVAGEPTVAPEDQVQPVVAVLSVTPEEKQIEELESWLEGVGLSSPDAEKEIVDEATGEVQAWADLVWSQGLQKGFGDPVALMLEDDPEMAARLGALGFRFFASVDELRSYCLRLVDGNGDEGMSAESGDSSESETTKESVDAPDVGERTVPSESLQREWDDVMASIYRRALAEANYNAHYFAQMLGERGGLDTARYLLHTPTVSDGFTHLWERGRLDLTVEAHVLQPGFEALFTSEERRVARERLEQYGHAF